MDTPELKKAELSDLEILLKISRETFYESFAAQNSEANMQGYLNEHLTSEKLRRELTNADSSFYLAILENKIIGYLKTNVRTAQTELKNILALEIERIYVSKDSQGKQIGKTLFDKAMQLAAEIQAPYLWLGVWEKNAKAIQFYKRNGLVEFDKHIFKLGDDEQMDILMKIELR